jgi:cyclin-C
LIKYLL